MAKNKAFNGTVIGKTSYGKENPLQAHRQSTKSQSQSLFQHVGTYNNLFINGLESIESDKEGEDLQLTMRK